jgi:uncharacterized CHY-type Zn-finger protein
LSKILNYLVLSISFFVFSSASYSLDYDFIKPELPKTSFPCSRCHDAPYKGWVRHKLGKPHHKMKFKHMDKVMKCVLCHNTKKFDSLRTFNGKEILMKNSQKLCGQCHGEKIRDWRLGIHGKQTGKWNGRKQRWACVKCHDPHSPAFPQWKADPGPQRPVLKGLNGGH